MGKIVDVGINSVEQIPIIKLDGQGNAIMDMIIKEIKKSKENENASKHS